MSNRFNVQTRTGQLNGWPPVLIKGETPSSAKYNAYLQTEGYYGDFAAYMREVISCKKADAVQSTIPDCNLRVGDKVVMSDCAEAGQHEGQVFTVRDGPAIVGGQQSVWLNGYVGCFAVKFLKRME
jgi:hypothetical protein